MPHAKQAKTYTFYEDARDFILCTFSIYFCYIVYGIYQEHIYLTPYGPNGEKFRYALFLVFFQSVANMIFSFFLVTFSGEKSEKGKKSLPNEKSDAPVVPFSLYAKLGLTYIGAMWSSNYALNFVSFPTQVLAKSCKIIPVMIYRILVLKHRSAIQEYVNMTLLTAGVSLFSLYQGGKGKDAGGDSLYGLVFLFISLALDAYTAPTQEDAFKKYDISEARMMLNLNFCAILIVLAALIPTGEMFEATAFLSKFPMALIDISVYSVLSALGQYSIIRTVSRFDSLRLSVITTTRKFVTIMASVVLFSHPLNKMQWLGVALVFAGLSLEIWEKYQKKMREHASKAKEGGNSTNETNHNTNSTTNKNRTKTNTNNSNKRNGVKK